MRPKSAQRLRFFAHWRRGRNRTAAYDGVFVIAGFAIGPLRDMYEARVRGDLP
jgi:hypothetical protein